MKKFNVLNAVLTAVISFASACGVGIAVMAIIDYYINGIAVCQNPAFSETALQILVFFLVVCSAVLVFLGWIITDEK